MFEISFPELMVLAIVGLVVIGPERLPRAARAAGLFLGRLKRYVNDVKADIDREMRFDELKKTQMEIQDAMRRFEESVHTGFHQVERELEENAQSLQETSGAVPAPLENQTKFATGPDGGADSVKT
ncbi:MAG: Sec-independent protein translocase protein TatB [Candidatus Accumulibacter sp.]|jgi:sec-independent protein translocase protein TatB|nr:Sec-independent protein translocase protein TatB [Accumulibacter sp.]